MGRKRLYPRANSLKQLEEHDLVSGISIEDNDFDYEGVNDYWVYLKEGYKSDSTGTHCVHEWGVKRTLEVFNSSIVPCYCKDCSKV
jgi:hypothetical protein